MATAKKSSPAKKAAKPAATVLNKTGLNQAVADAAGVDAKTVRTVMGALEGVITGALGKKGAGAFVLPGLLKISVVKVAAKPKRKGIDPFTKQERVFAAKPASVKVKVRPMKKLKDAASA
jgi:nucleoid DNA-binding protein